MFPAATCYNDLQGECDVCSRGRLCFVCFLPECGAQVSPDLQLQAQLRPPPLPRALSPWKLWTLLAVQWVILSPVTVPSTSPTQWFSSSNNTSLLYVCWTTVMCYICLLCGVTIILCVGFDELTCHCGLTVLYPPIPCGTNPPECKNPCTRRHECDHPGLIDKNCPHRYTPGVWMSSEHIYFYFLVFHNCHSEEKCPPCTYLTKKWCMGEHEVSSPPLTLQTLLSN